MAFALVRRHFGEDESLQLSLRIFKRSCARLPFSRSEGGVREQRREWELQALKHSYLEDVMELYGMLTSRHMGPSFGCSFLRGVGLLSCLPVVGASSTSAPGSLDRSILYYVGIVATIIGPILAAISLGLGIYYHNHGKGDGARAALDVV